MSEPIAPGDLVYVKKDCCGQWVGRFFTVGKITTPAEEVGTRRIGCRQCATYMSNPAIALNRDFVRGAKPGDLWAAPVGWLRKVPPLGELGERKAVVTLPALRRLVLHLKKATA